MSSSQAPTSLQQTRIPTKPTSPWVASVRKFFLQTNPRHDFRFLWLGGLVGLISSVFAIAFREGIDLVSEFFFGTQGEDNVLAIMREVALWKLIIIPVLAGSFVAWFTARYAAEAKGHGVPEIMNAIATQRGRIRPRVTVIKLIASALSIGSGGSVGREGPTALIGATVGSAIGQFLHFPLARMKMIVGCGTAAGIAATFNAPLAGTAFALELIIGDFSVRHLTPIILSAMVGTVMSHHYFGNFHALFSTFQFDLSHPFEIALYSVLGICIGVGCILFCKLLYACEDKADKIKMPALLKGAIGGLGIGISLIFVPEVAGTATWETVALPLSSTMTWSLAGFFLFLAVIKAVATSWTLAWGGSGGIFAPSLLIGSCLGSAYGFTAKQYFPDYTDAPSGYALVGMGAFVAGVTQAPLTAVTIIFELTHNMSIVLPLIVSAGFAIAVFNHFSPGSIYTIKLQRRGIFLEGGRDSGILSEISVNRIATAEKEYFQVDTPLSKIFSHFATSSRSSLMVVDKDMSLKGIVSFWDIQQLASDAEALQTQTAADVMKPTVLAVTPDQNLYQAFAIISSGDYDYLPVVQDEKSRVLVGRLSRQKLLELYKNQLTLRGIMTDRT